MDRRQLLGAFAGLPFLGFLRPKDRPGRIIGRVAWSPFAPVDSKDKRHGQQTTCVIGGFMAEIAVFPDRHIVAYVLRILIDGPLPRNGFVVESCRFKCKTIPEAKEWCLCKVQQLAQEDLAGARQTLRVMEGLS